MGGRQTRIHSICLKNTRKSWVWVPHRPPASPLLPAGLLKLPKVTTASPRPPVVLNRTGEGPGVRANYSPRPPAVGHRVLMVAKTGEGPGVRANRSPRPPVVLNRTGEGPGVRACFESCISDLEFVSDFGFGVWNFHPGPRARANRSPRPPAVGHRVLMVAKTGEGPGVRAHYSPRPPVVGHRVLMVGRTGEGPGVRVCFEF